MARTQKTFSLLLIIVFLMTESLPLFAYEEGIVNSLDVLPSIQAEKSILELKNDYENTEGETFARNIGIEEESYSLIAAREEYSPLTPVGGTGLTLGFFTNPFMQSPEIALGSGTVTSGFFGQFGEKKGKKTGIFEAKIVKNYRVNTGSTLVNEEDGVFQKIKTRADFQTGTTIRGGNGENIDPSTVGLYTTDTTTQALAKTYHTKKLKKKTPKNKSPLVMEPTTFEFGIPGTHLIFSRPVKMEIATPNFSDGIIVDIAVMHAGDTGFGSGGLSVSPDTLCNTDGSASKPGTEAVVQEGKVVFYTCGASSFTMNPVGGTAGSNDVRLIIGDYGQAQVYYNGQAQIYGGNPPATGGGTPSIYPRLNIGTTSVGNGGTAWTTATTTGSQVGNTYTAKTTLTRLQGGLTYTVIIDWIYTAPDKFFTWTYTITVPAGNTQNIRFYMGMDSFVAGADANDVGYYTTTPSQTVGVFDNVANVLSAQRYVSGATWAGYFAGPYGTATANITSNTNYPNTIQGTAGDLGYGINWNFGTTAGTYTSTTEWRLLPYVSTNVPDLIPGIGQPEGPLSVNTISQMPITVTNAGNATSSGMHTVVLSLPANISGPTTSFVNNGWTCGAQSGSTVTCNKITDIAALGSDTVRIPVIPAPSTQGQTLTFSTNISGGGDNNGANNSATVQLQVAIGAAPMIGPGGFTGSHVWLKADSLNLTDGANVVSWSNSGSNGVSATQPTVTRQPKYLKKTTTNLNDNINFNPVVALNGTSQNLVISGGILKNTFHSNASVYVVAIQDNISTNNHFIQEANASNQACPRLSAHMPWSDGNIYWDGGDCTTSRVTTPWGGTIKTPFIWSMNKNTGTTPSGNKSDVRRNGRQIISSVTTAGFTGSNSPLYLGSAGTTNFYSGKIAEVIITVGTGSITAVQQSRIESYLALKYGITLDQTAAQNYIFSNGSIVWNASTMGTVNRDIAGIGRDDTSGLSQQKSQSINNTGDIIVGVQTSIGTNLASLIWSNDGAGTGSFTTTDVPSGYQRIARKWRFEENNSDVGNVVVSYPASALPSGFAGTLYMLVDTDGVFAAGASPLAGIYNSSTNTYDFTTNIADGRYVTFARQPPSDTVAPTITSISLASGTLIPTSNFSLTVGYSDTGVINTSSFTGRIYAWDSIGGVWSTTNIAPSYMSISPTPTANTGTINISGLPFGKYRFDISVADNLANTTTQSYTYFVDAPEWSISSDTYTINDISNNLSTFGSGELIITVKTVGAGFNLSMAPGNTLVSGISTINYWNGTLGWGYDAWNGTLYPGTLLSHGSGTSLATTTKSINQNGQKNTYTYRIKFGAKVDSTTSAGDYNGSVNFRLDLNY